MARLSPRRLREALPATLDELAGRFGVNRTTVYRRLRAMESDGTVSRRTLGGQYPDRWDTVHHPSA